MADRDLIEDAAKACGLPECGWMGPAFMFVKDNAFTNWNPLEDDGDALQLAVKLRLPIEHGGEYVAVYAGRSVMAPQFTEHAGNDRCAATRRAIVRAAAAIGGKHDPAK